MKNIKSTIKKYLPKNILNIIRWYKAKKLPLLQNVFDEKHIKYCLVCYITNETSLKLYFLTLPIWSAITMRPETSTSIILPIKCPPAS